MNFSPNEKLVCCDDSPPPAGDIVIGEMLRKDAIYCVTATDPSRRPGDPGGVQVVGSRCFKSYGAESWWRADRFRRLSDVPAKVLQEETSTH